ncbi:transmembrane protein, putative (macronuclear) [Tetrahymena thermophila SB210]|uniref:Transmembrane protein, putative n=1 Tax=Tetrahymena thermophila (strain SB210) TaxID=312017 RepID=W7X187_TETTS|nr:transmembrane protein, putative [Tetrahymena thermophila SB210]EWS71327.1 transmembrane protein, putative [Tetrahymena thermophila SB210]|eukprot:XP_012656145.1 transmembrane protein, putative [Tetrahymena thermophila SB210]
MIKLFQFFFYDNSLIFQKINITKLINLKKDVAQAQQIQIIFLSFFLFINQFLFMILMFVCLFIFYLILINFIQFFYQFLFFYDFYEFLLFFLLFFFFFIFFFLFQDTQAKHALQISIKPHLVQIC